NLSEMTFTIPSPGFITKLAWICKYIPVAKIKQPTIKNSNLVNSIEGTYLTIHIPTSIEIPNIGYTNNCRYKMWSLKLPNKIPCKTINASPRTNVQKPKLPGTIKLKTYGTVDIGEVPKSTFVM